MKNLTVFRKTEEANEELGVEFKKLFCDLQEVNPYSAKKYIFLLLSNQ